MNCKLFRIHMLQKIATSKKCTFVFVSRLILTGNSHFTTFQWWISGSTDCSTLSSVLLIGVDDLVLAKVRAELVSAELFLADIFLFLPWDHVLSLFLKCLYIYVHKFSNAFFLNFRFIGLLVFFFSFKSFISQLRVKVSTLRIRLRT